MVKPLIVVSAKNHENKYQVRNCESSCCSKLSNVNGMH